MSLGFKCLRVAVLFVFVPLVAVASNVSVMQDVTIILPSDSSQYLLKASSSFDTFSIAVDPASFSFVMNPGDTVTITSADNKNLTNTINAATTCGQTSSVSLWVSNAQTVTVTPQGTCSKPSGATGGGGNGPIFTGKASDLPNYKPSRPEIVYPNGTVVYLDTTTISSTSLANAATMTPFGSPATPGPTPPTTPLASSSLVLTTDHRLGDHSNDVRALQKFLNTHGFTIARTGPGSPGKETTTFGSKTFQALKKFQRARGLPATGYLGPLTRSILNRQ
jgi:hypothetical protein